MEAEHTKRINHARAGMTSKGSLVSSFDFPRIFTPRVKDNAVPESLLPELGTSLVVVE